MIEIAGTERQVRRLGPLELVMLLRSLDPDTFSRTIRPRLYERAGNDPETVHELVLDTLKKHPLASRILSMRHKAPEGLEIEVNGQGLVVPFGTAAGLDKNGDALRAFSHFFGFMEPGTVVKDPREGNQRPRIHVDSENLDIYNAQGFPSMGLDYFMKNLLAYRKAGGKAPVYVSICGLPLSENPSGKAMEEMAYLMERLHDHVDGFVWNPASPNTAALHLLRNPQLFRETASLMAQYAPEKLRLVKMWPSLPNEKHVYLKLVEQFLAGGGHGIVTTNSLMVPRVEVPAEEWGYASAGKSGRSLQAYRLGSVTDVRRAFPDAFIIATGGIYTGVDAFATFFSGANMIEGYAPYTFYGLGLVRKIENEVAKLIKEFGSDNMAQFQQIVKELVRH